MRQSHRAPDGQHSSDRSSRLPFFGLNFVKRAGSADCMRLTINKAGVGIAFLESGRKGLEVFREKIISLRSESA